MRGLTDQGLTPLYCSNCLAIALSIHSVNRFGSVLGAIARRKLEKPIRRLRKMSGEMFNAAVLSFTLILVGLGLGFLLLKIQGGEEEA
ncbi:MAG TPA: PetM family cytochrome b6-f complex subunit 7 [Stenomitos sp.]